MNITSEPASFQQAVADSLNFYTSKGYTCTEVFEGPANTGQCTKAGMEKRRAEAAGEICNDIGRCELGFCHY